MASQSSPPLTTQPTPQAVLIRNPLLDYPELLAPILTDETNLAEARPAEIRRAIDGVEEERRVVLDAFEGHEMSILARMQRTGNFSSNASAGAPEWGIRRTSVSPLGANVPPLGASIPMQGASIPLQGASFPLQPPASPLRLSVASPARMRANSSPRRPTHARARLGSTAGQSFVSTAGQSYISTSTTGRSRHSRQQGSITSMASFSAPAMPSENGDAAVDEDDSMDELEDVRRRRADVVARYEARLEYLRALMRGAEIREKVRR
ncbi:hypothetical protein GGF50DRAFT_115730 [Schizophyllum commune]